MSNTISSDLIQEVLSEMVVQETTNLFGNASLFTIDASIETVPLKAAVVKVPLFTSTSSTSKNPTSFDGSADVIDAITINLDIYFKSWNLTIVESEKGQTLDRGFVGNLQQLESDIYADLNSLLLTSNFDTGFAGSAASFTDAKLQEMSGKVSGRGKSVILNDNAFAKFTPVAKTSLDTEFGGFGFEKIAPHSMAVGSPAANLAGFAFCPDAIISAWRIPNFPTDQYDIAEIINTPSGIPVLFLKWYSKSAGTWQGAFTVAGGWALGSTSKGSLIRFTS